MCAFAIINFFQSSEVLHVGTTFTFNQLFVPEKSIMNKKNWRLDLRFVVTLQRPRLDREVRSRKARPDQSRRSKICQNSRSFNKENYYPTCTSIRYVISNSTKAFGSSVVPTTCWNSLVTKMASNSTTAVVAKVARLAHTFSSGQITSLGVGTKTFTRFALFSESKFRTNCKLEKIYSNHSITRDCLSIYHLVLL